MSKSVRRVCLLALLVIAPAMYAQTPSLGVKGGYHYIWNDATIPVIPGTEECGVFTDGTSSGFYGGLTIDYQLIGDLLEVTGGVLYSQRPATLITRSQDNFVVLDPSSEDYVSLEREHVLTAELGYIALELGVRSRPIRQAPVRRSPSPRRRAGAFRPGSRVQIRFREAECLSLSQALLLPPMGHCC